ncbi:MAG: hypothetical protein IPN53_16575 [Comamonadaceae bacterium]|nr:hypothetical protein [Comamonadaceae bacterium]
MKQNETAAKAKLFEERIHNSSIPMPVNIQQAQWHEKSPAWRWKNHKVTGCGAAILAV